MERAALEPTIEALRALPKAELHCHLDGSLRPTTLLELGREYGVALPGSDAASVRDHMLVHDARDLEDYLIRFALTVAVLQHTDALERVAGELIEDVSRDGVRYLEVRYAPSLSTQAGLSQQQVVEAILDGLARGEREFGVRGRLIVCALRHLDSTRSMEAAELAVSFAGRGVVGFDLAGGERGRPASVHRAAFLHAREHGMARTVHAGEAAGPESIREAIDDCAAERIGHATRLWEDGELLEEVALRRIPLEICLTSNIQTHAAPSFEQHPLRLFYDRGLNLSLNTDNRLMSGTTLTEEYRRAAHHLGFTLGELAHLAIQSFQAAFLPTDERRALVAEAERELERIRVKASGIADQRSGSRG
jgi:adenosine deaminase